MRKEKTIKLVGLLLAMTVAASALLAGCGKPETQGNTQTPTAEKKSEMDTSKSLPMTFMINFDKTGMTPSSEELIAKKMKDRYNIDLKFEYMDRNSYNDKLNIMIAAGSYGEVIYMNDRDKMGQAAASGLIIPISDILKSDPEWKKVDVNLLKNGLIQGEYYFMPERIAVPDAIQYRTDWAEKVNIKSPSNPEEFYQMMYAFAKNDPDGNGKDDTYGFSVRGDLEGNSTLWRMFLPGVPTKGGLYYDSNEDSFKSVLELKEDMKTALAWYNKAYKEGVLDKEFLTAKQLDVENKFITGKTGVWIFGAQFLLPRYEKIKQNFPSADVGAIQNFNVKYGTLYGAPSDGQNEGFFLTNKCADPERGKKFMAYWSGPEGLFDRKMGEEGKAFTMENGKIKWLNEDAKKLYNPGVLLTSVHSGLKAPEPVPVLEKNLDTVKGFTLLKGSSFYSANSEAYKNKLADVNKVVNETIVKIIMGEMPVEKYDDALIQIKKAGLDDITKEVTAKYKEEKK